MKIQMKDNPLDRHVEQCMSAITDKWYRAEFKFQAPDANISSPSDLFLPSYCYSYSYF
jgi:hypothetical protein